MQTVYSWLLKEIPFGNLGCNRYKERDGSREDSSTRKRPARR